jgi:hypothetical protein
MVAKKNLPKLEAVKHDGEKIPLDLLPVEALWEIGKVLQYGATKYSAQNWRNGFKWTRLYGAILRHLFAWATGDGIDEETGLSHLAHAGCGILFLITHEKLNLGVDDRWINEAK